MPSSAQPPPLYNRHTPHHAVELGSSHSTTSNGQSSNTSTRQPISTSYRGHHHTTTRAVQDDEDEDIDDSSYEVVRTYESNDSVLPTYSPSASISGTTSDSSRLFTPLNSPTSNSRQSEGMSTVLGSMDSSTRRFGAGSFDPYASQVTPGEDKIAEKTRLMEGYNDRNRGMVGKGEKRMAGGDRYANLIPEKRPPQSPVSRDASP